MRKKTDIKIKNSCSTCFKELSVETKFELYNLLKTHPAEDYSVTNLAFRLGITQPTVSHHLKRMQKAGLLSSRKSGKETYYFVNDHCSIYDCECILSSIKFAVTK